MKVKLLRSRRLKRILLLECGKDFADQLLGFLMVPVGTLMKLLGSSLGKDGSALYNAYTSMTKLEDSAFWDSRTKQVLMDPTSYRSISALYSNLLPYGCSSLVVTGAIFFIGEDLSISRSSTSTALQILEAVESNFSDIDCREIQAGDEQVLLLVRAALASTTPLTDVFETYFQELKSLPGSEETGLKVELTLQPLKL
ncbi:hypothetical protein R1sor_021478 [Riccia sorocarpa]|uniref:Uncharacterized protein n=1 Tax=Riccia sorocarpa TaxID=122646 RepID=A0ABD3GJ16_9MARC